MKKLLAIVIAAAMLVTAFSTVAFAEEAQAEKDSYMVGYNLFGSASYALLTLANNTDFPIVQMGDTPMQTNANFQVETMIADVENMCNAGCDGVCLWIPDDSLYDAFIGICSKYNVPFVLVDKVPQDPEIAERVKSNPLFVGAVCPANAVYGQKIADYAVEKGWDTVLIGTPSKGDASDTPRLDAFLETFQANGGTVIDILYSENGNDAQTRLEASMMAEEPVFIYGTGSDYGIAAANALENTGMVGIPVTSL